MLNAGTFPSILYVYITFLPLRAAELQAQLALSNYGLPLKEFGNSQLVLHLKRQKLPLLSS